MTDPDFEAGYAAGQRDMRNRARQVVTALAHSGGASFCELARAIGALPIAGERLKPALPPIEMERVIAEVAAELGVNRRELVEPGRPYGPTMARWLAAQLGHEILGLSHSAIGRALRRDRTTVRHGLKELEYRLERSPDLREARERIVARLGVSALSR